MPLLSRIGSEWQAIIKIHILPKISRSKGNQTMKFGQLIEYNMINIFLKKSSTTWGGEASSTISFIKSEVLYNLFLLCIQRGGILQPRYRPLAFTSYKAFLKSCGTSLPALLSA